MLNSVHPWVKDTKKYNYPVYLSFDEKNHMTTTTCMEVGFLFEHKFLPLLKS